MQFVYRGMTCTLLLMLLSLSSYTQSDDVMGYEGKTRKVFGFESVEQALLALKAKPNTLTSVHDGWTIVNVVDEATVWSFPPKEHASFPSVVRREVVESAGKIFLSTQVSCGAKKADCEKLVQDFIALNQRIKESIIEE